ncbi:MAG: hypothetical protein WB798_03435 [Nocardioidaceae bacterium]
MRLRRPSRRRDERGVVTVIVAFLSIVLMMAAAVAIDATVRTDRQQDLSAGLDAAAQAGAYRLPDAAAARTDALRFVTLHDASETGPLAPAVDFWCIVASTGSSPSYSVETAQIPSTCNPGPAPYTTAAYPGLRCSAALCAIPCPSTATCNTIRVSQARDVPFVFAPAGGISTGSTGAVLSVACKGTCGARISSPMDVAVVADRTGSMSTPDVDAMVAGIKGMLQVMTPAQQYVALGTIGRSATTTRSTSPCDATSKGLTYPSASATAGDWVPVAFSDDFQSGGSLNTASPLVKGVGCLTTKSGTGTHLAAPLKAASRYLLGLDANNLTSLPARTGTPQKALIFETDGEPNESINTGSTDLSTGGDVGSTNKNTACTNMTTVASNAKTNNILIVTVAYNLGTKTCDTTTGSPTVASKLAAAASPKAPGVPSLADTDCSTVAGRTAENNDGDFFFCGASGDDLAPLFKTAFGQIEGRIRLLALP